jgi:putative transposase
MPRVSRIIAPGHPHHVTQRGNNHAPVFFDDEDRTTYLQLLAVYAEKHRLQIWAYCLMGNHVHILAVPEGAESLARGIGLTNQVYTQYLNRKLHHSGRLWQNRFFSCIVEQEHYLWEVARYIERNPLKAGLVESPEDYPWSSARAHIIGGKDPVLSTASTWLSPRKRKAYAEFVRLTDEKADAMIRKATRTGRPFGSEKFIDTLEARLHQPLRPRKPGRPAKKFGDSPAF